MKRQLQNNAFLAISLLAINLLSGQVSNIDFATQVYPIFQNAGCLYCHGSSGGFTIGGDAATAYDNVVNGSPGNCGLTYVVPGNPSSSFLYEKISQTPTCGDRMPANNPAYFDINTVEMETINVWIAEGAKQEALRVSDGIGAMPISYGLSQNHPNPFNPYTIIRFDLPQTSDVSLVVYDILGREVARLVDGYIEPGYHQAQWDGKDQDGRLVPSSIYIARLVTPAYTKSIKMVLLK